MQQSWSGDNLLDKEIAENHKNYNDRIELFKSFGYDISKERDFILEKSLPLNGRILEVGTGKGHFAITLARKGYHFTSVDISEEEQKYAKMNIGHFGLQKQIDFKIADAKKLNFDDGSFDVIFAINMVHHLSGPFKVIEEFMRVIRLAGKIVVSDFNRKGLDLVGRIHRNEGRIHPEGKAVIGDISAYLEKKRFRVENYETGFQETVIAHWFDMERQ